MWYSWNGIILCCQLTIESPLGIFIFTFTCPKMLLQKVVLKSTWLMFSAWARAVKTRKEEDRKCVLAHQTYSTRLSRLHFALWSKATQSSKATQKNPSPNIAAKASSSNMTSKQAAQRQPIKSDKENKQPNVLLSPLTAHKKRTPSFNSPIPKLVLDMENRRKERERRRQLLKDKQIERQLQRKAEEEERRKAKEKQEMAIQNAYLLQKVEEEGRKQLEAARRKQAFRLASLHYKMKLCHRMYQRWAKVFDVKAFNERKASLLIAIVSDNITV